MESREGDHQRDVGVLGADVTDLPMKPDEQIGDVYVPEEEARHLRFVGDWFWFRGGTLITLAVVDELDAEEPLLLRQYGADQLLLQLLAVEPDPSDWVRVHRFEGRGWSVEVVDQPGEEPIESAEDAMGSAEDD